jgi:hypothetical protein
MADLHVVLAHALGDRDLRLDDVAGVGDDPAQAVDVRPPSRVRPWRPSGRRTARKPSPWIATSSGRSVRCVAPCAKDRPASIAAAPWPVRTPLADERPAWS